MRALLFIVSTFLIASSYAEPGLKRHEFESAHMGTLFRIILYAEDAKVAKESADAAFALVEKLNSSFSDYDADSELMLLVKKREGIVSEELFEILTIAQKIAKQTDGAFDITNGAHTRNWRRARITGELPSPDTIAAAKRSSGWQKLHLDQKTRRVKLTAEGMFLDLGGIAKGYAVDKMLALLNKRGHPTASVAAGGDIRAGDAPPESNGWNIALAPDGKQNTQILKLINEAVSTSGNAEQKFTIGGNTYSHIVDAKTGLGLTNSTAVSVIAENATRTDALATALSVMGKEGGSEFAKKHNIRAIWPPEPAKN